MRKSLLALTAVLCSGACTVRPPAPPAPPARAPAVVLPTEAPVAGHGRVVLDSPGRPARVARVAQTGEGVAVARDLDGTTTTAVSAFVGLDHLCTTPCVIDLPRGEHLLRFSAVDGGYGGEVYAPVGERPVVVTGALGRKRRRSGTYMTGLLLGIVASSVVIGTGIELSKGADPDERDFYVGAFGVSTALLLGAGALMWFARPVDQPGAFTQFDLP